MEWKIGDIPQGGIQVFANSCVYVDSLILQGKLCNTAGNFIMSALFYLAFQAQKNRTGNFPVRNRLWHVQNCVKFHNSCVLKDVLLIYIYIHLYLYYILERERGKEGGREGGREGEHLHWAIDFMRFKAILSCWICVNMKMHVPFVETEFTECWNYM